MPNMLNNLGDVLGQAVEALANQHGARKRRGEQFSPRCDLSKDTKFLHALGLMDYEYEPGYCRANMDEVQAEINAVIYNLRSTREGFTSTHFLVKANTDGTNEYTVGNWAQPECPREAMLGMIANAAGKPNFNIQNYL